MELRLDKPTAVETSTRSTSEPPPPRRLVYLLSRYPGVSHTFFLNEVRELRALGFEIDVASINSPDRDLAEMPAEELEEARRTFYVKAAGGARAAWVGLITSLTRPMVVYRGLKMVIRLAKFDFHALLYGLFYLVEALLLGDWMRKNKQKHLHIHFCGPVATVGMIAALAWRFSYSLTVHGPDEFYDTEEFYLREKVENARFILCISNFCRSQLMRISEPRHWSKMQVVRLGVDPQRFCSSPSAKASDQIPEIVCVGRLVPSKGQLILLQAVAQLESGGCRTRVRLIGDGPDRPHLEAFAREHDLSIVFEGARNHEQVRALLGNADIFALASFAEGVPIALMEAMSMEIPCVSTVIAGIPELIRDGLEGLLVPASSVEDLAAALKQLIENPSLRRSLGTAGAKRVRNMYNLKENVRVLAQVLSDRLADIV